MPCPFYPLSQERKEKKRKRLDPNPGGRSFFFGVFLFTESTSVKKEEKPAHFQPD